MGNKTSIKIAGSKKIVQNTLYSSLSEISLVLNSIFYILAAIYLGEVGYGKLSSALAFVGLFSLIIIFGFSFSITKVIVRDRENAGTYIGNALYIQFILAVLSFSLCYLVASIFKDKYPLEVRYVIIIVFVAESLKCFNLILRTAYKALGEFRYATIAVVIERSLLLIVGGSLLLLRFDLLIIASVMLVVRLVGFLLLIVYLRYTEYHLLFKPNRHVCHHLLKQSWIYVVYNVFGRIYDHVDVVMISLFRTFNEVAWYSVARRILEGLWLIPNIVTEAVYPELSARHLVSKKMVEKLFDKSFKYIFIISVMVSMGTIIIGKTLIELIYGPSYHKATIVLLLFGSAIVPSFLRYLFGTTLISIDLQKKVNYISAGRSIVNVLLNLALITFYGYVGATIATILTEYISCIVYITILKREGLIRMTQMQFVYKPILATLVLIPIYMIMSFHSIIKFFIMIFLYMAILMALKIFDKEELNLFMNFFKKKLLVTKY